MPLDNNLDGHNDIAHFLEKFKETPFPPQAGGDDLASRAPAAPGRSPQYVRSFEKLEQKIQELEEKFEVSTTQNRLILSELARTREAMERQRDKDAFLEQMSRTIATLRTSVENLSQAQQTHSFAFREQPVARSFDPLPTVFAPTHIEDPGSTLAAAQETARLRQERDEQTRLFNSLRQKASQLKAVNTALDREIKKAQQEKMEALKKSAGQAKEILSLRDQLTAAEERFKSFDFEGRIITIKREYQQKVTVLETQLKEMSDTCIKQVEEIESLKAENSKLQAATVQKESLQAQLADKEKELAALKNSIASLQAQRSDQHAKQLAAFTARLRTLEEQRDRLAVELEQSQISLETMRREKELLEKNFKELVVKINHNDSIISQLRQKIDVLGRQNEELAQSNTVLTQDNAALSQSNVELTHRNAALTQSNATLTRQTKQLETQRTDLARQTEALQNERKTLSEQVDQLNQTNHDLSKQAQQLGVEKKTLSVEVEKLNREKQTLTQSNQTLSSQRTDLQKRTNELENREKTLREENQQLRNQNKSAALLAARIVRKKAQQEAAAQPVSACADNTSRELRRPAAPLLHSLGRTMTAIHTDEEWEMVSAKAIPAEPKRIESAADLPEIKVAATPQEDLIDGEDFLEKTNSFIGRMKWSIFRENR